MTKKTRIKLTPDAALAALAARGLGTHEEALVRRVEIDVAKWGESERAASRRLHQDRSHGLLVNAIAVADPENPDRELMNLAAAIFTSDDRSALRRGG